MVARDQSKSVRFAAVSWSFCIALVAILSNLSWSDEPVDRPWRKYVASLVVVNVDGSDPIDVSNRKMTYFGSPQWSRDGQRIAYDAWQNDGGGYSDSHIFVCDDDGSNIVDVGRGGMPSWSADGTQVVGHTYDQPAGTYMMSTDGQSRRSVALGFYNPCWSPVDDTVALLSTGRNISLIHLKTNETRELLEEGWSPHLGIAWSPDGRRIAFPKIGDGPNRRRNEVAIANLDPHEPTGDVQIVAEVAVTSSNVAWSPDGKRLAFAGRLTDVDRIQIYTLLLDGDSKPERFQWQDADRNNSAASWSPDGKRMLFLSEK